MMVTQVKVKDKKFDISRTYCLGFIAQSLTAHYVLKQGQGNVLFTAHSPVFFVVWFLIGLVINPVIRVLLGVGRLAASSGAFHAMPP